MSTCSTDSTAIPISFVHTEAGFDVARMPGLEQLWASTLGDPRICIAVLDGPVDLSHPVFQGAALSQVSVGEVTQSCRVRSDHGTHVTSIIFGQHHSPVKGIAPRCRGLIVPIFDYAEDGSLKPSSEERLATAIRIALRHGANIINISGGQFSSDGHAGDDLKSAVAECEGKAIIIAAAGNDGCNCLHIPSALPSVLTVGAMSNKGEPLPFSNWGEAYRDHGVLAPGENILGASLDGRVAHHTGTSFATPIVSGIAGLALSHIVESGRLPQPKELREAFLQSAITCEIRPTADCSKLLSGRLSVAGVIKSIKRGPSTMPSTPTVDPPGLSAVTQQRSAEIKASSCGCGCKDPAPTYVYPVGRIAYDFVSQIRRDSIHQHLSRVLAYGSRSKPMVEDPIDLLRYLCGFKEVEVTLNSGQITALTDAGGGDPHVKVSITVNPTQPLIREDDWRRVQLAGVRERRGSSYIEADADWADARLELIPATGAITQTEFILRNKILDPTKVYDVSKARWYIPRFSRVSKVHPANPHDARSLIWKLVRGEKNLYAIQPRDAFAEDAYGELVDFLLHSQGLERGDLDVYYYIEGGRVVPWFDVKSLEQSFTWDTFFNNKGCCHASVARACCDNYESHMVQKTARRLHSGAAASERVSMPGRLKGETRLLDGTLVQSIDPEMRGTLEWSIDLVMESMKATLHAKGYSDSIIQALAKPFKQLVERLDEEARNPGLAPSDRALTYAYVQLLTQMLTSHADELIVDATAMPPLLRELDAVTVQRAAHCRDDDDCWDVEISFFNPREVNESLLVIRQSVAVGDVVPVFFEEPRSYRRR